jgi:hypothetical protein
MVSIIIFVGEASLGKLEIALRIKHYRKIGRVSRFQFDNIDNIVVNIDVSAKPVKSGGTFICRSQCDYLPGFIALAKVCAMQYNLRVSSNRPRFGISPPPQGDAGFFFVDFYFCALRNDF